MAMLTKVLEEDFNGLLERIEKGLMASSVSIHMESKTDFKDGESLCSIRVFERYSLIGKNRVSLNIVLFKGRGERTHLSATASGGSQATFFKLNTFGEEAFLRELEKLL